MEKPSAPTVDTVATLAGVGRGTVSRVINGSPQVSTRSRQAVEKAISELGYVPNPVARSLVTRRTGAVALVISESADRLWGEPYFAGVIRGISHALSQAGLRLMMTLASTASEREQLEHYLMGQHVDGVMLISLHGDDALPKRLQDCGLAAVLCGAPLSEVDVPYVDSDNRTGAQLAAAHLAAGGRRRIATITGTQDMSAGRDRLAGYQDALQTVGLPIQDDLIIEGDFSEVSGIAATRALLDAHAAPDAIFAASDPMALGALRVLGHRGLRVPEDVAVVGFDDSRSAAHNDPPLTSVSQPVEQLGREMVRLLTARIDGAPIGTADSVLLPTHLVTRATS